MCDRCIVETMEEMLVEEGMARGDAFDLAQEWALTGDRPDHLRRGMRWSWWQSGLRGTGSRFSRG